MFSSRSGFGDYNQVCEHKAPDEHLHEDKLVVCLFSLRAFWDYCIGRQDIEKRVSNVFGRNGFTTCAIFPQQMYPRRVFWFLEAIFISFDHRVFLYALSFSLPKSLTIKLSIQPNHLDRRTKSRKLF